MNVFDLIASEGNKYFAFETHQHEALHLYKLLKYKLKWA